jgi:hypothetical protein
MKVKVVASVLAGVMSVQNVAFAASRVDGIGATQISAAQSEVEVLRNSLVQVENSLVDARTQIEIALSDKNAPFAKTMNIVHVGTAAIGLGLGALAVFAAQDPRGKGIAMAVMTYVGGGLAAASSLTGLLNDSVTKTPTTEEAQAQLAAGIAQVKALAAVSQDTQLKSNLLVLESSLMNISSSINDFTEEQADKRRAKITREITQAVGVALAVTLILNHDNMRNTTNERIMMASAVAQTLGNLMVVMTSSSVEQYESILGKIDDNLSLVRLQQATLK